MLLAQRGDRKSYETLFRSITPPLRAMIRKRINNAADAEDILQDILLSIHRASHTYDSNRPLRAWVFAIARHRLSDHWRRLYRNDALPPLCLDDLVEEIACADVTIERERSEYLGRMLDKLPEKQREIVTMMKIEGHSVEDTAKAMNMSVPAVKVSAHRAYKALARTINRDDL